MRVLILISAFMLSSIFLKAQDSLVLKGQVSSWINYNTEIPLPYQLGGRYIPQLNYSYQLKKHHLLDLEVSANIFGSFKTNLSDSLFTDGNIKAYRAWMRFSGKQFELRVGLQKINFGAAVLLRPLMWFDGMDARDPLNLTDGVWGLLGRYYFLNNANLWAWILYGNEQARGWEIANRNAKYPEFGGRFQFLLANTEIGFSYHHQYIDARPFAILAPGLDQVSENKMGLDIKWDGPVGLWLETSWSEKNAALGLFKNQEMFTLGMDYTFGIGSGLNFIVEHLWNANDEKAFEFQKTASFSAVSFSYPVGIFDKLSAVFYYDWNSQSVYNFVNWQKTYNAISIHLMAYWNPVNSSLPNSGLSSGLYGGKGLQLMLVFNY